MSIFGGLRSGVSGLFAQSQSLGIISDNIANVNTVGYKASRARFSTLVTQQVSETIFATGGVQARVASGINEQGLLSSSTSSTDLAVSGSGFFAVTDALTFNTTKNAYEPSGNIYYTRAGEFHPDHNGNLTNTGGFFLLGFPRNTTDTGYNVTTVQTSLDGVNIASTTAAPVPTSNISLAANLNSSAATGDTFDTTIQIFDRQGTQRTLTLTFTKVDPGTSPNTWNVSSKLSGGVFIDPDVNDDGQAQDLDDGGATSSNTANDDFLGAEEVSDFVGGGSYAGLSDTKIDGASVSLGSVEFNANGTISVLNNGLDGAADNKGFALTGEKTFQVLVDYDSSNTTSADAVAIDINLGNIGGFKGLTQFDGVSVITDISQNGKQFGNLSSVSVNDMGELSALFDNGEQRQLFQVPLVTFNNPNGLDSLTGNIFSETIRSGDAYIKVAKTGGAGSIMSSSLEASTVDLADEFTKLIVTQRAFSANTRIITTADEMLEELIRIRR